MDDDGDGDESTSSHRRLEEYPESSSTLETSTYSWNDTLCPTQTLDTLEDDHTLELSPEENDQFFSMWKEVAQRFSPELSRSHHYPYGGKTVITSRGWYDKWVIPKAFSRKQYIVKENEIGDALYIVLKVCNAPQRSLFNLTNWYI